MSSSGMGPEPVQREAAKAYFLAHPTAKDKEVCDATGLNKATVARARWKLIDEGLLPPATRRRRGRPAKTKPGQAAQEPPARDGNVLLTGKELIDIADIDFDELPDDEARKKMLKELRKLAFSPDVSNDTRISAMKLWIQFKDSGAGRKLGPGDPLTYEQALDRLRTLMKACGFKLVYEAFTSVYLPKETPSEGKLPAQPSEATPSALGATPAL